LLVAKAVGMPQHAATLSPVYVDRAVDNYGATRLSA
jgi:hypothetical protein